jgi:hypothetical protein
MKPWEADEYLRIRDRLPHNGWAGYGPYEDKRAKLADLIIGVGSFVGIVVLLVLDYF